MIYYIMSKINKYQNGKIYKIVPMSEHAENEVYYGSTTRDLDCRLRYHRFSYIEWTCGNGNRVTVYDLFSKYGVENCYIQLLEHFPCNSKDELEKRESDYIRANKDKCVNKVIPNRTKEEWYQDNKTAILERHKAYNLTIKDKMYENAKKPYTCVCGVTMRHDSKGPHMKTKKHLKFMEQQNI
jgi:hypothetical protein